MMKAAGKRLKIEFSNFHKGPGEKVLYDTFVRDLGCAVRDKVPTLASTFSALTDEQQAPLMDYLKTLAGRLVSFTFDGRLMVLLMSSPIMPLLAVDIEADLQTLFYPRPSNIYFRTLARVLTL